MITPGTTPKKGLDEYQELPTGTPMKQDLLKRLAGKLAGTPLVRSSLYIGGITVLAKVLGYVEKMVLAYYFGTSYQVDVYTIVVAILLSVFIFTREIVEPGFLQTFLRARHENDEKGAWGLFFRLGWYIVLGTGLLSVLVYFFPTYIIDLFAPGFGHEQRALAVRLIRVAFPATVLLSLSTLTNITLNGLKKFALPTSGELAFKAGILLCFFALYHSLGIYAAVWGIVVGAAAKLLVHGIGLARSMSFAGTAAKPRHLRATWLLTWPLLIGVSFSQLSSLVDNVFASYLAEGAISALAYAKKVVELPILVFPYILSVVAFPYFSELSIANKKQELVALLGQTLGWITLVFVPLSVFYVLFATEIVEIVFKRGAFTQYSTLLTARPLAWYAVGMVFFAIETVLVIFYFSISNTRTPIITGILCALGNILFTYVFNEPLGYIAIPLALVLAKATKVVVLGILLHKEMRIPAAAVRHFLVRVLLASVAYLLAVYCLKSLLEPFLPGGGLEKMLLLGIAFLGSALVYLLGLFILKFRWIFLLQPATR
jgi:murein biosynthesis integral membrane protein MurJ